VTVITTVIISLQDDFVDELPVLVETSESSKGLRNPKILGGLLVLVVLGVYVLFTILG